MTCLENSCESCSGCQPSGTNYGTQYEDKEDKNKYVICSCRAVKPENEFLVFDRWYQHSEHCNRMLHFCTAITKENYLKLNGFDEEYSKGIAYEDDDFREKILVSDLKIILRDDLLITHMYHDTVYQQENHDLVLLNGEYYRKKWRKE